MTTPDPAPDAANSQQPQEEIPSEEQTQPAQQPQEQEQQGQEPEPEPEPEPEQQPAPAPAPAPGPRATRLHDIYAQGLHHTLSKLSPAAFASCYPTVAFHSPRHLEQIQRQSIARLGERAEKEYADILARRAVVVRLNELDGVVGEAVRRRRRKTTTTKKKVGAGAEDGEPRSTPPHLLPVEAILAAHMHPILSAHGTILNTELQTTQSHNAQLWDEVQAQRREIEELVARLEGVVGDVRGANEALGEVADALAIEAREGREAVRSVDRESSLRNTRSSYKK